MGRIQSRPSGTIAEEETLLKGKVTAVIALALSAGLTGWFAIWIFDALVVMETSILTKAVLLTAFATTGAVFGAKLSARSQTASDIYDDLQQARGRSRG